VKRRLDRLLRVRWLLEELAGREFSAREAETRTLEQSAASNRRRALAARSEAWGLIASQETAGWLLGLADADILDWKADRTKAAAAARKPAADAARAIWLARRLERRQLETLAAAADRVRETAGRRREQRAADDWFQSRSARRGKR
jgi:flagellar export protein FliJ